MPESQASTPKRSHHRQRPPKQRTHPELVGLVEAAERCDVDPRTIRRWIAAGRLPAVRVGPRLLKLRLSDLDALMKPVGAGSSGTFGGAA